MTHAMLTRYKLKQMLLAAIQWNPKKRKMVRDDDEYEMTNQKVQCGMDGHCDPMECDRAI